MEIRIITPKARLRLRTLAGHPQEKDKNGRF